MKSAWVVTGLSAAAFLFVTGCMQEREYVDPQAHAQPATNGYGNGNISNLKNGFLKGDIGPVTGLNGPAEIDGYDDPQVGSSTVNLTSQAPNGSGLVILNLDRSISSLPNGETHMTGANDMANPSYVQLCSDTAQGATHFDGIAQDVRITVTPAQNGERNVDITAQIAQGFDGPTTAPTTVSSHFTITQ